MSAQLNEQERELVKAGKNIEAIRSYRMRVGASLREAHRAVMGRDPGEPGPAMTLAPKPAPRYFADSGFLYADFGDGRCAKFVGRSVPTGTMTALGNPMTGFVHAWEPVPAPDASLLWPAPLPVADRAEPTMET